MESWLLALATAVVTGLVTWGGVRVELRWLRRDLDKMERRQDRIEGVLIGRAGRSLGSDPLEHRA